MEAEEVVMKVDEGIMEADLEEASEAKGGVSEPHSWTSSGAVDHEGGVTEAKAVTERWSVWLDIILSINYETS
ncbi:hypothetical protein R1flu_019759 [Riccia fluitans]|uniref:Uncharacterized protein n=1 Tax=Riccia fluitans TaxID=41844 RepID=A0ABD1ZJJ4_9MARC